MFKLKTFLIKERVGFLKIVDTFDIYDPATGAQVGIARENISVFVKVLRFLINKRLLPTTVEVREREGGRVLLTISRGVTLLRSHVKVTDGTSGSLHRKALRSARSPRSGRGSGRSSPRRFVLMLHRCSLPPASPSTRSSRRSNHRHPEAVEYQ